MTEILFARLDDVLSGLIPDGDYGDIIVSGTGTILTLDATIGGNHTFSGTINVPTAAPGTDNTVVASTAFVNAAIAAIGSGGSSNFLDLTDTPDSYAGETGKVVAVNAAEDGLEFITASASVSAEDVQDIVGAMVSGNTETLITVSYQDADGTLDFVVNNDLSLYSNATSGFLTSTTADALFLTPAEANAAYAALVHTHVAADITDLTEVTQDTVGAMVSGNTETLITVTYQDSDGTLDFVVNNDLSLYSNATSGFLTSVTADALFLTPAEGNAAYAALSHTHVAADITDLTEVTQDTVGAMTTGNTETLITVTYQDSDGTIDFVVNNDLSLYSNATSGFLTATTADALFLTPAEGNAAYQPLDSDLTAIAALTTTAAGRSGLTVADPNVDRVLFWDDSAATMKLGATADFTVEASPASGDKLFIQRAGTDDLAIIDWDDLPGSGGGTPGGNNGNIQYKSGASFAGDDDLMWVAASGLTNLQHMAVGNFAEIDVITQGPGDPIYEFSYPSEVAFVVDELVTGDLTGILQSSLAVNCSSRHTGAGVAGPAQVINAGNTIASNSTGEYGFVYGLNFVYQNFGSGNIAHFIGMNGYTSHEGSGTIAESVGVDAYVDGYNSAPITNAIGGRFEVGNNGALLTNVHGIYIADHGGRGSTISNNITSKGATSLNVFEGTLRLSEITALAAPPANTAHLFVQDNGSGKTQLAVRFPTGAVQIIATEV